MSKASASGSRFETVHTPVREADAESALRSAPKKAEFTVQK
jgi:hypothetical protein